MHLIEGRTADDVWREAATRIERRAGTLLQRSPRGETVELLHTCLVISEPTERWVVSREPAMNPAFALAEVIWMLSGRDDADFLNFWNPALPRYAGRGPLYYGAYGKRLRHRFGVDQIRTAFEALRANPDARQIVLQIWDATSDLPSGSGEPRSQDIPCNVCSMLKVREGLLEWVQVMRSNDLRLGWPHNVVQFTTLQEMMAGWLGTRAGAYTHFSDSLHVYADDSDGLCSAAKCEAALNTDRWEMPYAETMAIVADIGRRMDAMRNYREIEAICRLSLHEYETPAATNTLLLVGADAVLRAGALGLADELADRCTNPALRQLWARWRERRQREMQSTGGVEA